MKLEQYIRGALVKSVVSGEAGDRSCRQHEFNGVATMRAVLGNERRQLSAVYLYVTDDGIQASSSGNVTWYDAREKHPSRSEYRLFYETNPVTDRMSAGDSLFFGILPNQSVLILLVPADTLIDTQLRWMLGLDKESQYKPANRQIEWVTRSILEQIGITLPSETDACLDDMLARFRGTFPRTKTFSEYARSTLPDVDSRDDPDSVLMAWMEREESLFRTLEDCLVKKRIQHGFSTTDEFIQFSLSVHNRRKSRVGFALENHFECLLTDRGLRYTRAPVTENKSKPDFIFPGIEEYKNSDFPTKCLTMLGAKSTCKDRWRQVLAEADRIQHKHLLTLEGAISISQTEEMQQRNLQLVVPRAIHHSYKTIQQKWLMSVADFLMLVDVRQRSSE